MVTPTCNTCKTKFPGKDVCVKCGADPNGKPNLVIQMRISSEEFKKSMRQMVASMNKLGHALAPAAKEMRKHERRQIKAHLRSIQNHPPHRPHGHQRGR